MLSSTNTNICRESLFSHGIFLHSVKPHFTLTLDFGEIFAPLVRKKLSQALRNTPCTPLHTTLSLLETEKRHRQDLKTTMHVGINSYVWAQRNRNSTASGRTTGACVSEDAKR